MGFIRESAQCSSTCFKNNDFQLVKNEMNLFEGSGKLTDNLQKLQSVLSTIKPTRTQNGRNFSIFGHFVSKRRTRLSDKSIDCLCVLKSHFKSIYLILSSTFLNIYFFNNKWIYLIYVILFYQSLIPLGLSLYPERIIIIS